MEAQRAAESNNNDNNGLKISVYDVIGESEQELARQQYPDDDVRDENQTDEDSGMLNRTRPCLRLKKEIINHDDDRGQNDENFSFNHSMNPYESSMNEMSEDMGHEKMSLDNLEEPEQLRKLFIGGLDYKTSETTLKQHFERFGDVIDCVVMREPQSKRSRGFGFVIYKHSSMVDRAQEARPHKVDGREVQSKRAISREDSGKPEAQATVKKVYLGGLSDDIEESELRSYFKEFGNIININIVSHKDTGKRRGFAFVEYDDYDPVDKIVLKKFHIIKDKRIEAKKAIPKVEMDARKRGDPRVSMNGPIMPLPGPPCDGPGPRSRSARGNDSCFWDSAHVAGGYPSGYSGPANLDGYPSHYHTPPSHYSASGWLVHGGQGGPYGFRNSHGNSPYVRNNYSNQASNWPPSTDYGGFPAVQGGTGGPVRVSYQHRNWNPYGSGYGSTHRGRGYNS